LVATRMAPDKSMPDSARLARSMRERCALARRGVFQPTHVSFDEVR
jgi:hypothetical protein